MIRFARRSLLAAALLLGAAGPALAEESPAPAVTVTEVRARATSNTASSAAYMSLRAEGGDRLVGVGSARAKTVEIHESFRQDGAMSMRRLPDGIALPAGQDVKLAPGGLHVMLMGLDRPFQPGETVPLTLTFEKAAPIEIEASVMAPRGAGSAAPSQATPAGGQQHHH